MVEAVVSDQDQDHEKPTPAESDRSDITVLSPDDGMDTDGSARSSRQDTSGGFLRGVNLVKAAAAIFTGFIALLVALVGLVFALVPTIKPAEPPEKLGGRFEKTGVEHNVSQSQYEVEVLHLVEESRSYPLGMLVRARVELSGFKARHYRVLGELWDTSSARPHQYALRDGETVQVSGQDLRPSASTDAVTFQLWVRNPTHSGRYFIRLRLYDVGKGKSNQEGEPGALLDYTDTTSFSYRSGELEHYWIIKDFQGDGVYTVNGELQRGTYELSPPHGTSCSWTRLRGGGDPLAPDEEHTIARGVTTKRARISLSSSDVFLVLHGCGHVRLVAGTEP
jgi:hypothetical protein